MDNFLTTPNWLNSNFLFAVLFGPLPCFVYSASFLLRGELLSSYWSWGVAIYNLATFLFGKHSIYLVVFHKLYQGGELGWDCLQMIMVIVGIFFLSYLLSPADPSSADHSMCSRDVTSLTVLLSCGQFLAQRRDQDLDTRQEWNLEHNTI